MPKLALPEFLDALTISGATENTFRVIVNAGFDTLDKIRNMKTTDLANLTRDSGVQIGQVRAAQIYEGLRSPRIAELLDAADAWLDTTPAAAVEVTPVNLLIDLKGVTVVMTGAGPAPRGELEAQARAAGAIVQGSVSKTTQLLICESANSTSSKAEKARKLGTRVIGYAEVFPGGSTS